MLQTSSKLRGAYWFGSVCPSMRSPVRASGAKVTLTLGQQPLVLGSRNLVSSLYMKIKRTCIFSLVARGPFYESCVPF